MATPADEVVALAVELIRLDTVNPALVDGAAGERAAVDLLAGRLGAGGFTIEVVTPTGEPHRPSLVATHRGAGGGRSLVLNGHLDTVGVDGMAAPFEARIAGDRLFGRGACDMKAGVAAMVVAAERASAAGTAGDVVLALAADEEHASIGTAAVIEHLRDVDGLPAGCLVAEPTWLDLVVAHRGFTVVDVELRGRAAHSSQPERGVNALAHLGRLLTAVEAHDAVLAAHPPHRFAGTGSLLATVARAGDAPFTLPADAHAVIERRTVPGESPTIGLDEVQQLLDELRAADPSLDATASLVLARDPWQADTGAAATSDMLALLSEGLVAAGWPPPRQSGAPYWMESAMWAAAGVPAIVCGPAGGGMHAEEEWVDLAQLRAFTAALLHLVPAFTGSPGEPSALQCRG